jgi:hypothetical protein
MTYCYNSDKNITSLIFSNISFREILKCETCLQKHFPTDNMFIKTGVSNSALPTKLASLPFQNQTTEMLVINCNNSVVHKRKQSLLLHIRANNADWSSSVLPNNKFLHCFSSKVE